MSSNAVEDRLHMLKIKRSNAVVLNASMEFLCSDIPLPARTGLTDDDYHIYIIGKVTPSILGLEDVDVSGKWSSIELLYNKYNAEMFVYNRQGLVIPSNLVHFTMLRDGTVLMLIQKDPVIRTRYLDEVYYRYYKNAYVRGEDGFVVNSSNRGSVTTSIQDAKGTISLKNMLIRNNPSSTIPNAIELESLLPRDFTISVDRPTSGNISTEEVILDSVGIGGDRRILSLKLSANSLSVTVGGLTTLLATDNSDAIVTREHNNVIISSVAGETVSIPVHSDPIKLTRSVGPGVVTAILTGTNKRILRYKQHSEFTVTPIQLTDTSAYDIPHSNGFLVSPDNRFAQGIHDLHYGADRFSKEYVPLISLANFKSARDGKVKYIVPTGASGTDIYHWTDMDVYLVDIRSGKAIGVYIGVHEPGIMTQISPSHIAIDTHVVSVLAKEIPGLPTINDLHFLISVKTSARPLSVIPTDENLYTFSKLSLQDRQTAVEGRYGLVMWAADQLESSRYMVNMDKHRVDYSISDKDVVEGLGYDGLLYMYPNTMSLPVNASTPVPEAYTGKRLELYTNASGMLTAHVDRIATEPPTVALPGNTGMVEFITGEYHIEAVPFNTDYTEPLKFNSLSFSKQFSSSVQIRVYLNGFSMVEDVDFFVANGEVIITNTSKLTPMNKAPDGTRIPVMNKVLFLLIGDNNGSGNHVKYYETGFVAAEGFVSHDSVVNVGYDHSRVMGNRQWPYTVKDFSKLPLVVRASIMHKPYMVGRPFLDFDPVVGTGKTLPLFDKASVNYRRIEEYLTNTNSKKIPPVTGLVYDKALITKYEVYSPFMTAVMKAAAAELIADPGSLGLATTTTAAKKFCKPYQSLLDFDPLLHLDPKNKDFVVIRPYPYKGALKDTIPGLDAFMSKVVSSYSLTNISPDFNSWLN